MAASSKIPWDKLKADTLRAICRDFGANPGKRKREGMLEFLRAVETTDLDEALKLNIEDKDDSSPRRPSTKRARPAEEQAPPAVPAESSPEAGGRPKRKAAPAPATEAPVKSRGKKAKTDAAPSTAAPPASKGKKASAEKKAAGKVDEDAAAREQQEADEVDALADEPAENGAADSADQGAPEAPNAPEPNVPTVVVETVQVEAVITA
ncbi:hypothetical protein EDB89DRAFT_1979663 [Lactarius sanguifluus]|nr:hypothetical protein EDB89DRAFT_1979663 [Lactarius sanguifluus]